MNRILTIFIIAVSAGFLGFDSGEQIKSADSNESTTENFVNDLLSKMTLEEKIGQMTEVTIDVVSKPGRTSSEELELDMEKLREAIVDYKVGSILNTGGAANSVESWHKIITAIQDMSLNETRLGIPNIYGVDAIHGNNYTLGATIFPQAISMAATRNRDLMRKAGEITAYETRASGIAWNYNPVLGMGREPLWPRLWETFGEDVYLTSEMGREYIIGQQGDDISQKDKVATCIKHYMGYSVPKNGNDRTPALIPERTLREVLLPPFAEGVKAGALTAMVNSSEINGIPAHSDKYLITDILKGELGLKGFVVSDWEDIKRLHTRDRVAETPKEAVKMAVMAGLDMSMVPSDYSFYDLLLELVNDGDVPMSRIDDAVSRILYVKHKLGLFDNPYPYKELVEKFACDEFTEANIQAAREVITLLENKNSVLPLDKDKKVLVTGPTANLLSVMNGGWTITWQGNEEELYPGEKFTVLEAIQEKIGKDNVVYVEGTAIDSPINVDVAINAAANVDAVILCLGEPTYCETEGNIENLELYEAQLDYALKLYETGKPVILVMIEGRPRVINKIADGAEGVIMAYLPGMEGGLAIADVLFGDYNPSGKLPVSYPRNVNGYTCYDRKPIEEADRNRYNPQWRFGHGLSYTTFEYTDLKLDRPVIADGESITALISVRNIGNIPGDETVELYLCDLYGSVTRPVEQLKGFEKISLEPNESKNVEFTITPEMLSFIGRDNKRIVEPGNFKVMIKDLEKEFVLK